MDASVHRFLNIFSPAARDRLTQHIVRTEFPDGAYLFREGDAADGVYVVLEGNVEIVRDVGKHEKILNLVSSGDYFGEVAVFDGLGRSTAARARGASVVAVIPGSTLLDVISTEPGAVAMKFLRHVLGVFRRLNDQFVYEIIYKEKLTLVGEMANSLSHDLRCPVSTIRLSADLIEASSRQKNVSQWCAGIRLQCDRLVGMTVELMEFSKGESKLALDRITTGKFLDQFKTLQDEWLSRTGVAIHFKSEPAEIEIDAMRMQRVLQNLVTNAVEALQSTPHPRVDITLWLENSTFHLSVKDNGPGIPAAIQERIFEPFVTHGKSGGIGLGMAVVQSIVTAHRGTVTFETAAGHGTSFLVSLPQGAAK